MKKTIIKYLKKQLHDILEYFNLRIHKDFPRNFIKTAKKHFKNKEIICAEIGVRKGINARSILKELNVKKIYLIDPYEFTSFDYFMDYKEVKKIAHKFFKNDVRAEFIKDTSDNAVKFIREKLDFVYIDGNHEYEFVKRDIGNYWKLIKEGGILAGHDFERKDVALAVFEFINKNNLNFDAKGMDWWIVK